jgi:cofilin
MEGQMKVADECQEAFIAMIVRMEYRYVIYKIEDNEIVVADRGPRENSYNDLVSALEKAAPRYAVVDFDYDTIDRGPRTAPVFIIWNGEARTREKMVYLAEKGALTDKIPGIKTAIVANEITDLDEKDVLKAVLKS